MDLLVELRFCFQDEADTLVDDTFSSKSVGLLSYLSSPVGKNFAAGFSNFFSADDEDLNSSK